MDSATRYNSIIKVVLLAYILLSPFLGEAPIVRIATNAFFVSAYLALVVVIACLYDVVAAILLAVVLLIWITAKSRKVTQTFSQRQEARPEDPAPTREAPSEVEAPQFVRLRERGQDAPFQLPPSASEPVSIDEYTPTSFGAFEPF